MATTKNSKTDKMKKTETAKTTAKLDKKGEKLDMKKAPLKSATKAVAPAAKSTKKAEPKVKLEIAPKAAKGAKEVKLDKVSGKKDKKSEILEVVATVVSTAESEEDEEMDVAPASNGGGAEAGLASAAAAETAAGSLKNFRHHPDLENFYRFIYENDLRYEALEIIDVIVSQRGMIAASKAPAAKMASARK